MRQNYLLVWCVFAVIGYMAALSPAVPSTSRPAGFEWLGGLPVDQFYSTRAMRVYANRGVIVKEHSMLISNDGGHSWNNIRNLGSSVAISSAWLTPSLHILRLSGDILFVSNTPSSAVKVISLKEQEVSYLAPAATENLQRLFLVGGKSVMTTAQQLESLPQYAHDGTTDSPRMIVPIIYVSSDNGQTWQTVFIEKAVGYLDSVKVVDQDMIAWGPYAVYSSTDAGRSWKLMTLDIPEGDEDAYPVSATIVGHRAYVSLKNGRLLRGEVAGLSLRPFGRLSSAISQLTFTSSCVGFGISPSTTNDEDVVMETKNGGQSWAPIFRAGKIVALTSDGSEIYGATDNHAFRFRSDESPLIGPCDAQPE